MREWLTAYLRMNLLVRTHCKVHHKWEMFHRYSQNHKMVGVKRDLWSNPPANAGSSREDCTGTHPGEL